MNDQEQIGATLFLEWLPDRFERRASASLEALSGLPTTRSSFRSNVVNTVEEAWSLPLSRLTCEHVRMLTSQKFGLEWIGKAVAEFVCLYPRAEITFYPGDLSMAALKAFNLIAGSDAAAGERLRGADFSWMAEEYTFDRSLAREAEALITQIQARKA